MAEKKPETTALTIFGKDRFSILSFDDAALGEIVKVNLGEDEKISEFDLGRYRFPSGRMKAFSFEGIEGERTVDSIEGVIVAHQTRRAYWSKGINEGEQGTPPDCWSPDGIVGNGAPAKACGGFCANCPHSQFGTAKDEKGAPAKGQACQQRKAVFIISGDQILPDVVFVPPTSLASFKTYLTGLISRRKPVTGVVTKITLKGERNTAGTEYAEGQFAMVGALSTEDTAAMTKFGAMFSKMFRPTPPKQEAGHSRRPPREDAHDPDYVDPDSIDKKTGEVKPPGAE